MFTMPVDTSSPVVGTAGTVSVFAAVFPPLLLPSEFARSSVEPRLVSTLLELLPELPLFEDLPSFADALEDFPLFTELEDEPLELAEEESEVAELTCELELPGLTSRMVGASWVAPTPMAAAAKPASRMPPRTLRPLPLF